MRQIISVLVGYRYQNAVNKLFKLFIGLVIPPKMEQKSKNKWGSYALTEAFLDAGNKVIIWGRMEKRLHDRRI